MFSKQERVGCVVVTDVYLTEPLKERSMSSQYGEITPVAIGKVMGLVEISVPPKLMTPMALT